jgi:hypothetical protein
VQSKGWRKESLLDSWLQQDRALESVSIFPEFSATGQPVVPAA